MSITNPDKVVTKQDLADFYDQIKPYLGSYPVAIANKFSKGDIYSTTEKMIGQWTDGKPLYQKTINFGSLPNATSKSKAHGVSNIGTVVSATGWALSGSTYYMIPNLSTTAVANNVSISVDATNIVVGTGTNYSSIATCYITLQYTKTTDSSTAMGNETDYSTTEKIVGTWIDGKPIYQKTFQMTSPTCTTDGTEVVALQSIGATVESIVSLNGIVNISGNWKELDFINVNVTSNKLSRLYVQACSNDHATSDWKNKIRLINGKTSYSEYPVYVTIQYTKTT